jgi:hypothetical protein
VPGPPRLNFPSAPSEPSIRRLGVRSSTHIDRPIRPQVVLPILVALLLLAIPLYLLRSPSEKEASKSSEAPVGFAPSVPAGTAPVKEDERLVLGEVQRLKCSSSVTVRGKSGRLCDELPFFESALKSAISESVDCAPRTGDGGTLNYVLKVDFNVNTVHVFPGASGVWKGPQARRATQCVKRALPAPDWDKIPHDYRYYELSILAEYKPPSAVDAPLFE